MSLLKEIPQSDSFLLMKEITKGMSGERKYYIETKDNQKYLLRIADVADYEMKKREFNFLAQLNKESLPVPTAIDCGICEEGKSVYTLLGWVEGEDAETVVSHLSTQEQYKVGYEAGKILRRIHEISPANSTEEDWYDRYLKVVAPRIEAYRGEGIPFDGAEEILQFLENNKELLRNRPQCNHHGDYHMGNLVVNQNLEISVIDWHTVDFDGKGDPWYEFNRIQVKNVAFTVGQINGYFEDHVPEEFWRLLALYLSISAITSIVWAKYFAPEELDEIISLNRNIVKWFNGMESCIPTWYQEYKNKVNNEDN